MVTEEPYFKLTESWKYFIINFTWHLKFTVRLKNAVFWDVTLCSSCKNRRFGGTYGLHHQGDKNRWAGNNLTANVVSSTLILVTLMMEAIRSSKTLVLTRATWRNISKDDNLHSHSHENLKSYTLRFLNTLQ
jgi:hypothetical protein